MARRAAPVPAKRRSKPKPRCDGCGAVDAPWRGPEGMRACNDCVPDVTVGEKVAGEHLAAYLKGKKVGS